MNWRRRLSQRPERNLSKLGNEQFPSFRDKELIHCLHQWLNVCRAVIANGEPWEKPIVRLAGLLRKLLDAHVVALRVDKPPQPLVYVSSRNPATAKELLGNRHFVRLCERLFAAPRPMLILDALEGGEFADPYLRSQFPKLSILTAEWRWPSGQIQFAFLSDMPRHFSRDHIILMDYFKDVLLGSTNQRPEDGKKDHLPTLDGEQRNSIQSAKCQCSDPAFTQVTAQGARLIY